MVNQKKTKKIAITGLSGVVGQVLSEELPSAMQFIDLFHNVRYLGSRKISEHVAFDLLNRKSIPEILDKVEPDIIIHMAAVTHIDVCESDRKNGKKGITWATNVLGSYAIAKYCARNKIPLVFLSTECVFDGESEFFSEDAKKNPKNWYGATKSEAEDLILSSGAPAAIIRSVVAYHLNDNSKTIYGKILNTLQSQDDIVAVHDQLFTPTYTYDIVSGIRKVVEKNLRGVYHVAPKRVLSPYDFALLVASKNKYNHTSVKKITLKSYYDAERAALRLQNSCLLGEKSIKALGFIPKNPEEILI